MMPWDRILSQRADRYQFDVGLMKTHTEEDPLAWNQGLLNFLIPTIMEDHGRITRLRCFAEGFGRPLQRASLGRAFTYLTSLDLVLQPDHPPSLLGSRSRLFKPALRRVLMDASDLQELSIALDCDIELFRVPERCSGLSGLFTDKAGQFYYKWRHLRSLRLAFMIQLESWLLPLVDAHSESLRHLDLEQCNLTNSFATRLSQIHGLQLNSIIILQRETPRSELISEEGLLRFVRRETVDTGVAENITMGHFVTHNGHSGMNDDDESFEGVEVDQVSDHSSEWWSDADSDSSN